MSSSTKPEHRSIWDTFVSASIQRQVRILLVIAVIMLGITIWDVIRWDVNPLWILVGVVPGVLLGRFADRMKVMSWDETARAVVSRMDLVGVVVLVLYILVSLNRERLIELGIKDINTATVIGLAMSATSMFTRVSGTLRGVGNVLRKANLPGFREEDAEAESA